MENEDINPWLHLWTKPRKTLKLILSQDPCALLIWLAISGGIVSCFTFAAFNWFPPIDTLHVVFLLIALMIVGAIFGIAHLYFIGWLLKQTGSWLSGQGRFIDVKCAVGWSNYPFITANLAALLALFFSQTIWLRIIFSFIYIILYIWGLFIFLKLIGEAHRFSIWKAICALLIAIILIFLAFMLIALLVPLLSPLFQ